MKNLLFEEIWGNLATVYHRTTSNNVDQILTKKEWKSGFGAGNMYGTGLYTVFNFSSNNPNYGDYIWKLHIKGLQNFFIFLVPEYNKVYGTNFPDTYESQRKIVEIQEKKFNMDLEGRDQMWFAHNKTTLRNRVAGIVFHGRHDGDVCIIWKPEAVIPVSYSEDNGKTWKKASTTKEYTKSALNNNTRIELSTKKEELKDGDSKEVDGYLIHKKDDLIHVVKGGVEYVFSQRIKRIRVTDHNTGKSKVYDGETDESRKELNDLVSKMPPKVRRYVTNEKGESLYGNYIRNAKLDKERKELIDRFDKGANQTKNALNKSLDNLKKQGYPRYKNENVPDSIDYFLNHAKMGKEENAYGKFKYRDVYGFSEDFIKKTKEDISFGELKREDLRKEPTAFSRDDEEIANIKNKISDGRIKIGDKIGDSYITQKYGLRTKAILAEFSNGKKYFFYKKRLGRYNDRDNKDVGHFKVTGELPNLKVVKNSFAKSPLINTADYYLAKALCLKGIKGMDVESKRTSNSLPQGIVIKFIKEHKEIKAGPFTLVYNEINNFDDEHPKLKYKLKNHSSVKFEVGYRSCTWKKLIDNANEEYDSEDSSAVILNKKQFFHAERERISNASDFVKKEDFTDEVLEQIYETLFSMFKELHMKLIKAGVNPNTNFANKSLHNREDLKHPEPKIIKSYID